MFEVHWIKKQSQTKPRRNLTRELAFTESTWLISDHWDHHLYEDSKTVVSVTYEKRKKICGIHKWVLQQAPSSLVVVNVAWYKWY